MSRGLALRDILYFRRPADDGSALRGSVSALLAIYSLSDTSTQGPDPNDTPCCSTLETLCDLALELLQVEASADVGKAATKQ